jgi:predicted MFS family arabinose efflux permease
VSRYVRVVAASGLANLGDGIRQVALPLLAALITRDPVLVGGLTACAYVPWMFLGLPIGALVDRHRPELFLVGAAIARFVLLGILTVALVSGNRSMLLLYVVAFALGIGEAAYDNASQSLIPRVVPDEKLDKANSALVTVERFGQDLAGPAAGGVLFAASAALPFGLSAIALLISAGLVVGIRTESPVAAGGPVVRGVIADAAAGVRWLWRGGQVRTIVLTGAAGLTFFTQVWEPLLVLLAVGPMGVSDAGFGVILAVGAGGGIVGALLTPALLKGFSQRTLQIAALALAAVGSLLLAAFPTAVMAAAVLATTSVSFALWNVLSVTMRQRLVPSAMLARVNAANRTLSMTAGTLGTVVGGAVGYLWGLTAPLWLSGGALVAVTLLFMASRRTSAEREQHAPAG